MYPWVSNAYIISHHHILIGNDLLNFTTLGACSGISPNESIILQKYYLELILLQTNMESMVSRDRFYVNDIILVTVSTWQYNHSTLSIIIVINWSILRIIHSRIYQMMLTLLEHSTTKTTFPMHASILTSWFLSTKCRDVGLIDSIEQSLRSTTPISFNNVLRYIKAFVTLAKSKIPPLVVNFDNLEYSRAFLVEKSRPSLPLPSHYNWNRSICLIHLF